MKLNKEDLPFGVVTIHFWDKPYQEINFKTYLNNVPRCKQEKLLWLAHVQFNLTLLVCAHLCDKTEKYQFY